MVTPVSGGLCLIAQLCSIAIQRKIKHTMEYRAHFELGWYHTLSYEIFKISYLTDFSTD